MTLEDLARRGRALYGERWQTSLAQDLGVTDRTMRRWVAGHSPIPTSVSEKLGEIMNHRLNEIGGIVGYFVNHSNQTIVHLPTNACFRYDSEGNLNLLNSIVLPPHQVPIVTEGAKDALVSQPLPHPAVFFRWGAPSPV